MRGDDAGARGGAAAQAAAFKRGADGCGGGEVAAGVLEENLAVGAEIDEQRGAFVGDQSAGERASGDIRADERPEPGEQIERTGKWQAVLGSRE